MKKEKDDLQVEKTVTVKEEELIENENLRNEVVERVEILGKVGELFLLPNTELATTRQVADYYGVDIQAIYNIAHIHKSEIESDGYKTAKSKELIEKIEQSDTPFFKKGVSLTKGKGGYYLNGKIAFPYSKTGIFTKRAILRVGMLLRDSVIAKKIRTQLLNGFERLSDEQKIQSITDEQLMLLKIAESNDPAEVAVNLAEYRNYKNRHIAHLEATLKDKEEEVKEKSEVIQGIADDIPLAEKRQVLNRIVRKSGTNFASRWSLLYKEFNAKYHINLSTRVKNYNEETGSKTSIVDYIQHEMKMLPELYEVALKVFESDTDKLVNELYETVGR